MDWHTGERSVHKKLKLQHIIHESPVLSGMPMQHQVFFSNLQYFAVSYLDDQGRPWGSILCGNTGFLKAYSPHDLEISTTLVPGDPLLSKSSRAFPLAGLGIDFSNRRRNKVFGFIDAQISTEDRRISARMYTTQSLGNCPKYINCRKLEYHERTVNEHEICRNDMDSKVLPSSLISHVSNADTCFISTRHLDTEQSKSDLDINHRGGRRGFLRVTIKESKTILYLPDYSGNRLFQSLGNIETDPVAGMTIPDFETGDVLYITGAARNIFDKEAQAIMPGMGRLTEVTIDSWIFVPHGINLRAQHSDLGPSPYNPIVSYLAHEPGARQLKSRNSAQAELIKKEKITPTITIFTWAMDEKVRWKAGQYAIFNFSDELDSGYQHMSEDSPQTLNDNYNRSWTIVSPPSPVGGARELSIMVRKSGIVSSFLHKMNLHAQLTVPFLGIDGTYGQNKRQKVLYICGGIGVTPFLTIPVPEDDNAIVCAVKEADGALLHLFEKSNFTYRKFCIAERFTKQDIEAVPGFLERQLFCCGPARMVETIRAWFPLRSVAAEEFSY